MISVSFIRLPALAVALILTLSGCSKNIDAVKEATSPIPQYKIGQLLDHKENCLSTKWRNSKDDKGREVVEYRCEVKVRAEVLQGLKQQYAERLTMNLRYRLEDGVSLDVLGSPGYDDRRNKSTLKLLDLPRKLSDQQLLQDPDAAPKLQALQQLYDETLKQLEAIDAPCQTELRQRVAATQAQAAKFYDDRAQIIEIIRWTLNDAAIVEQSVDFTLADGTEVPKGAFAGALYGFMLNPNSSRRAAEEEFVMQNLVKPALEESDTRYCGRPEAYQPVEQKLDEIQMGLSDLWKARDARLREQREQNE